MNYKFKLTFSIDTFYTYLYYLNNYLVLMKIELFLLIIQKRTNEILSSFLYLFSISLIFFII